MVKSKTSNDSAFVCIGGFAVEVPITVLAVRRQRVMTQSILFGFLGASSPIAYVILGILAILLFGNRLPSVMRSLGRSVVEFKKGVAGIEDELDDAVRSADEKPKAAGESSEA